MHRRVKIGFVLILVAIGTAAVYLRNIILGLVTVVGGIASITFPLWSPLLWRLFDFLFGAERDREQARQERYLNELATHKTNLLHAHLDEFATLPIQWRGYANHLMAPAKYQMEILSHLETGHKEMYECFGEWRKLQDAHVKFEQRLRESLDKLAKRYNVPRADSVNVLIPGGVYFDDDGIVSDIGVSGNSAEWTKYVVTKREGSDNLDIKRDENVRVSLKSNNNPDDYVSELNALAEANLGEATRLYPDSTRRERLHLKFQRDFQALAEGVVSLMGTCAKCPKKN